MKYFSRKQQNKFTGLAEPRIFVSKTEAGFSTLEILIAMTILILTLTSVTITAFGGQSVIVDSRINVEALNKAQELLEEAQLLARKDYQLINPTSTDESVGGITYHKSLGVTVASDHATKEVTATISWAGEHGRMQHTLLTTLVTNFSHAIGGNTCDSVLSGDWQHPVIGNSIQDFRSLIGTTTDPAVFTSVITSVDAHKGRLYVTLGDTTYKTDPSLYVFDIANLKTTPSTALLGKIDTATTTKTGLYAVHIAEGTTTGSMYAYVANKNPANWSTCTAGVPNCAQLQIIDVSSSTNLSLVPIVNLKVSGVNVSSGGVGDSIFYKDGFVYLGLTKATGVSPEFNIIDVHDPLHPMLVPGGQYNIEASVNAIVVSGNYAYLATSDGARELVVLDISNPTSPVLSSVFNASGGGGSVGLGQSLYKVGDDVYLGRTNVGGSPEFYMLDASTSVILSRGSFEDGSAINGLLVRNNLAFFTDENTNGFHVLNIDNPVSPVDWAAPIPLPNNSLGSAIDCEGNDIFVSSRDASSNNGYLSAITASP